MVQLDGFGWKFSQSLDLSQRERRPDFQLILLVSSDMTSKYASIVHTPVNNLFSICNPMLILAILQTHCLERAVPSAV